MKKIFSPEQKGKIALAAVKEDKRISELASQFEVHPNIIGQWKKILVDNVSSLFFDKRKKENREKDDLIERLYSTIGKREAELDWLKKKLQLDP
jgi:transposase-like protein